METTVDLQASLAYCQQQSRQSGSNFLFAFRLLPKERRQALCAFYTFCREIDDVADHETLSVEAKGKQLTEWRLAVENAYRQRPLHQHALIALQPYLTLYAIPKRLLLDILDGVEMDLTIKRYESFSDLYPYCYRVAGAVGMVSSRIFGSQAPGTDAFSEALGIAFQLTNIIRDVGADLAIDRVYLPVDEIRQAGYSIEELRQKTYNDAFRRLMRQQYERAVSYYEKAEELLPVADRTALQPAMLMRDYYRAILEKIAAADFQVFAQRIRLSKTKKLLMIARYWRQLLGVK